MANSKENKSDAARITMVVVIGVVIIAGMIFRFNVVQELEISKRIESCSQSGGSYVKVTTWMRSDWECHGKDYKGE